MASIFNKLKGAGTNTPSATSNASPKHKKEDPTPELTPLEKMLQNAGPIRRDGSDKFFGLENFGNTCYCNSIVHALYYSESFRHNVVNYPLPSPSDAADGKRHTVNVTVRPPIAANGSANGPNGKTPKGPPVSQVLKPRPSVTLGGQMPPGPQGIRPEDKPDSPEYKKKQAMIKGPVLELAQEHADAYGIKECTFTGLKDIFSVLIESQTRTGVLSPQRFLEIFKRDNEFFRNSMHQDAHEFYGLVLNDVIATVEANARRIHEADKTSVEWPLAPPNGVTSAAPRLPGTGWVHDIFEGVLTSETKCLTCETASQRDETFLDLSIDLEEHSSVTSCLRKFSAEEMLCERNKFHCDHCGGLQEAEKRMKIKRLPKVLALHLKRFKYTEDYSRLQKLFHRVVYPYHLRMFNTTDDADDPDRMYELYAVVIHIGGNAYHGHYVAVIKTQDRGWLLFDDEMVEPVDKHFVRNFFGDKPGMACAYVLFYQETTFEKVREEQEAEGLEEVKLASQKADLALGESGSRENGAATVPLSRLNTQPDVGAATAADHDPLVALEHAHTDPGFVPASGGPPPEVPPLPPLARNSAAKTNGPTPTKPSKEEREREKKELKAAEKQRKAAEKAAEKEKIRLEAKQRIEKQERVREAQKNENEQLQKALQESRQMAAEEEKRRKKESAVVDGPTTPTTNGLHSPRLFGKANRGSKTMARKSFAFLVKSDKSDKSDRSDRSDKSDKGDSVDTHQNGSSPALQETPQEPSQPPPPPPSQTQLHHHLQKQPPKPEKLEKPLKERFSFGLGRKKSEKLAP